MDEMQVGNTSGIDWLTVGDYPAAYGPSRPHHCRCSLADEAPRGSGQQGTGSRRRSHCRQGQLDSGLQGGRRCVPCASTGLPAERSSNGEVEEGDRGRRRSDWAPPVPPGRVAAVFFSFFQREEGGGSRDRTLRLRAGDAGAFGASRDEAEREG
jgi:hypothetical protein